MKYSNYVGVISCLAIAAACFIPWVYIASIQTIVTGMGAAKTNFGHPGLMHIILCTLAAVLFLTPYLWAKRTNLFVGAFNLAWSIRNFIVITQCEFGDCPEKRPGIYLTLALSVILLLMTFLPEDPGKK
jgi:hypothetical protein